MIIISNFQINKFQIAPISGENEFTCGKSIIKDKRFPAIFAKNTDVSRHLKDFCAEIRLISAKIKHVRAEIKHVRAEIKLVRAEIKLVRAEISFISARTSSNCAQAAAYFTQTN